MRNVGKYCIMRFIFYFEGGGYLCKSFKMWRMNIYVYIYIVWWENGGCIGMVGDELWKIAEVRIKFKLVRGGSKDGYVK